MGGVITCSAIISILFYYAELKLPLGLSYLPLGVFCFGLGKFFSMISLKMNSLIAILLLIVHFLIYILCPSLINFHKNEISNGVYWIALVDIIVIMTICYYLSKKKIMNTSWLSFIGCNSMIIFVSHAPVIVLFKTINDTAHWFDSYCLLSIYLVGIIGVSSCLLYWRKRLRKIF